MELSPEDAQDLIRLTGQVTPEEGDDLLLELLVAVYPTKASQDC